MEALSLFLSGVSLHGTARGFNGAISSSSTAPPPPPNPIITWDVVSAAPTPGTISALAWTFTRASPKLRHSEPAFFLCHP